MAEDNKTNHSLRDNVGKIKADLDQLLFQKWREGYDFHRYEMGITTYDWDAGKERNNLLLTDLEKVRKELEAAIAARNDTQKALEALRATLETTNRRVSEEKSAAYTRGFQEGSRMLEDLRRNNSEMVKKNGDLREKANEEYSKGYIEGKRFIGIKVGATLTEWLK
jgi:hypothetical protein